MWDWKWECLSMPPKGSDVAKQPKNYPTEIMIIKTRHKITPNITQIVEKHIQIYSKIVF